MTKYCPCCQTEKDVSEFHKNSTKKDGLASSCKTCKQQHQHEWYKSHTEEQRARVVATKRVLIEKNRKHVEDYLKSHPCVDCGEADTVVLEFDHVRGKKLYDVAKMKFECGWEKIQKEISKCEVRCANCHRRMTHRRRMQVKLQ